MGKKFTSKLMLLMLLFSPVIIFGEVKWICATEKAEFGGRYGHQSVVFQNKMWVLNGCIGQNEPLDDIWCSTNGKNWTKAVNSVPYSTRTDFSATVFNDRLWVIAGYNGC